MNSCPASPSGHAPSFDMMVRYASSLLSNQATHPAAIAEEDEIDSHPAMLCKSEGSHDPEEPHEVVADAGSHDDNKEQDETIEEKESDDEGI